MDPKTAGQIIRDSVSMDQILSLYGYRAKHGFMPCPFHGEKVASLRVYDGTGGWHCFGCGKGGSVIDFVMEHEGCGYAVAVRAIDKALNLRLMDEREHPQDAEIRYRKQVIYDRVAEAAEAYLNAVAWEIEIRQRVRMNAVKAAEEKKLQHPEEMTNEDYMIILTWRDESEWDDYQAEKIEKIREEVKEWRRKARRPR
jgi:DNA primase